MNITFATLLIIMAGLALVAQQIFLQRVAYSKMLTAVAAAVMLCGGVAGNIMRYMWADQSWSNMISAGLWLVIAASVVQYHRIHAAQKVQTT